VLVLDETDSGIDLRALIKTLGSRDMLEVYCEGGGRLATSLLAADLVDRLEINYGAVLLGSGGPDIGDLGVSDMSRARRMHVTNVTILDDDLLVTLEREETS
jgi:diaminohydroxyphosphoribosylaminopyrimidine deaminase/5-amino-6-(5-phosphoribosylamino)uracil reductase